MEDHFEENYLPFTNAIRYRIICPKNADRQKPMPVLLALHGLGMSAPMFQRILRHLELTDMLLVIPEALYPFEIRGDKKTTIGHAWYLYTGDQEAFLEQLKKSEQQLLNILDKVGESYPIDPKRSVILGFSQGGYLAGFMALRQRHRFAGLIISSARLKHEFLHEELAAGHLPATLFVHGSNDKSTPWSRTLEGLRLLEEAGGSVTHYLHEEGHRLSEEASIRINDWLGVRGFDSGRREAAHLKAAWKKLDEGEPQEVLEMLVDNRRAREPEALLISAVAQMDLEQFATAREGLEKLSSAELDGDSEFLRRFYLGQCCFCLGDPEAALNAFHPLEPADPIERANIQWWLGLSYDHLGKSVRADECFAGAAKLDADAPRPLDLDETQLTALVEQMATTLPLPLQEALAKLEVLVQDLPPRDLIAKSQGKLPPDLLGILNSNSLIAPEHRSDPYQEQVLFLYRRNWERAAKNTEELQQQMGSLLLQELGEHLGYAEDALEDFEL